VTIELIFHFNAFESHFTMSNLNIEVGGLRQS
jgi:hypothetical protein